MKIDEIHNGYVLDHIRAGRSMEIYRALGLDSLDCTVAIIKNVPSRKLGKKDIIKIDEDIVLDLAALGYIDPNITINVIKDGLLVEKQHLKPPAVLVNVVKCKNPRCITSTEQEIDQIFRLSHSGGKDVYRCAYCEMQAGTQ
ncbi:MAG: aspartate carbamoyltransferase regulatory subunit [Oscillospiraceae bacterium]|nr:aspartate carbamoyltransferase regulatory subunit [Oscillospiraceae bacterium]